MIRIDDFISEIPTETINTSIKKPIMAPLIHPSTLVEYM